MQNNKESSGLGPYAAGQAQPSARTGDIGTGILKAMMLWRLPMQRQKEQGCGRRTLLRDGSSKSCGTLPASSASQ